MNSGDKLVSFLYPVFRAHPFTFSVLEGEVDVGVFLAAKRAVGGFVYFHAAIAALILSRRESSFNASMSATFPRAIFSPAKI